jgi:orotate phosphoribosyltransferase
MQQIIPLPGESLLDLARRCNAVYVCPKREGVRTGPLVVYAGKDDKGNNLVGDDYFDFRKIEEHPRAVEAFAEAACEKLRSQKLMDTFDTVCGIPQGGRTFGYALARAANKRFTYADKKPKPTEAGKKQEYTWDLSEFEFKKGERVALGEDVVNNCRNTHKTLEVLAASGATVVLIIGALNRSPLYDHFYTPERGAFAGINLPVVASIREAYPEYTQDDPMVVEDIAAGNLELEVKKNWSRLRAIMDAHQ